ncbi:MAG TPA: glycosyltransferase family 4 protein [Bryobacteraceae bacterium]|nr:glycosyltransferase family 4 protein [Bryobacteraceae bacterium]
MRVLHIVKTSEGARWAALQAAELVRLGVEVHVALPAAKGHRVRDWEEAQAVIHIAALDYPARNPWRLPAVCSRARALVASLKPDVIHAHHFGPAMLLRQALGKKHPVPRVFQVPGPLHLEHWIYRTWDLASAGAGDFWIASSRSIRSHYLCAGILHSRVFLSYSGFRPGGFNRTRSNLLRRRLGIAPDAFVFGNINYIYPPKYHLGQRAGIKRHEDLIDALGLVLKKRGDAVGVLAGGTWGRARRYQESLQRRAERAGGGRILMPGELPFADVQQCWADFDCAIHVPVSENCGGVVEPLLAGVPTIAGDVGGLPEVVMHGVTGIMVPIRNPQALAAAMLRVAAEPARYRMMARLGGELVAAMFDVRRTAAEVYQVYRHILDQAAAPPCEFDARAFVTGRSCLCA